MDRRQAGPQLLHHSPAALPPISSQTDAVVVASCDQCPAAQVGWRHTFSRLGAATLGAFSKPANTAWLRLKRRDAEAAEKRGESLLCVSLCGVIKTLLHEHHVQPTPDRKSTR